MSARDEAALVVDARMMEPPEPFVRATMEGLDELKDGKRCCSCSTGSPIPCTAPW